MHQGEIFGFLGHNGAGKTTTIKLLLGLLAPTAGQAWILDRPIEDVTIKEQVGFLPEAPYFYEYLTAGEFLTFYGQLFGLGGAPLTKKVEQLLEMVALTDAVVLSWRGLDVRRLAETDARFALYVIDRLSLFATMLTEKLDGFLHQDAQRRVIRVLARHRDLFFSDPPVLTRTHLPGLVGTSREMTGRVLRALEREGVVARVGRAGLRLLDSRPLDALPREVTNQPGANGVARGPVLA